MMMNDYADCIYGPFSAKRAGVTNDMPKIPYDRISRDHLSRWRRLLAWLGVSR